MVSGEGGPSAVAFPVTTNHAAKGSVFINLKSSGNLKNCSTTGGAQEPEEGKGLEGEGQSGARCSCGITPQPSTLNPQPQTLNSPPSTRNPQPSTLNPQLSTLNPNPQPSTLNPKPPTLKPQPSPPNPKLQTLSPKP